MAARLDHLVIVAKSLQQGRDYVLDKLGVDIPRGGKHAYMSTHNCLMQLGNQSYLEVITIDPDASPPPHPRWYDLDSPLQIKQADVEPSLVHWVVNVDDMHQCTDLSPAVWGKPHAVSRDDLSWRITIPEDGRLPAAGFLPTVIQWDCPHPAPAMPDTGCRLLRLKIYHNRKPWLEEQLHRIATDPCCNIPLVIEASSQNYLEAHILCPKGEVILKSHWHK